MRSMKSIAIPLAKLRRRPPHAVLRACLCGGARDALPHAVRQA